MGAGRLAPRSPTAACLEGARNTFSTGPEDVPSGKYSGLWDTTCVRHVCARSFSGGEMVLFVALLCISLIMCDVEHLFMHLLAICLSSLKKSLFSPLQHVFIGSIIFPEMSFRSCLYIFEINSLLVDSVRLFSHVRLFVTPQWARSLILHGKDGGTRATGPQGLSLSQLGDPHAGVEKRQPPAFPQDDP